jgi:hypothetical protein
MAYRGRGLSTIRATAAGNGLDDLGHFAVVGDDQMTDVDDTGYAGAQTLQASVVRLYGVVLILGRWVRVGCARLCGVHSSYLSVGRAPGSGCSCGAISVSATKLYYY